MTTPEQETAELVGVGAQVISESAKRLGLTWTLRPATVSTVDGDGNILATYDGDTEPIAMINLGTPVVVGARVMALFVPPAGNFILYPEIATRSVTVEAEEGTNQSNLSNTTFAEGSPACSTTFTAPSSGKILVLPFFSANSAGSGASRPILSFEIYEGPDANGSLVVAAADANGVVAEAASGIQIGGSKLITGLTPGITHFIRTMQRVTGGAVADIFLRRVTVVPAP